MAPFEKDESQRTLMSLLELDPAPIESPELTEKTGGFITQEDVAGDDMESSESTLKASLASTGNTGTTSPPGLSGNGHGAMYYRKKTV